MIIQVNKSEPVKTYKVIKGDPIQIESSESIAKSCNYGEYAYSTNPALIKVENGFFGFYKMWKISPFNLGSSLHIHMTKISNEGKQISDLKLNLEYNYRSLVLYQGIEDVSIFKFNNRYWLLLNVLVKMDKPIYSSVTAIREIDDIKDLKEDHRSISYTVLEPPKDFDKNHRKNWSPFEYNNELYVEYSIIPRIIFKVNVDSGHTELFHQDKGSGNFDFRGGVPSILLKEYDIRLSLGHRALIQNALGCFIPFKTYTHFWYTFHNYPPFSLISMSDNIIFDEGERIQYARTISREGDRIYVSYGVMDRMMRITSFMLDQILSSLNSI